MPQQPAASRPGAVQHVLLPGTTAGTGAEGGAQAPAGAPLQHTALRKTPGRRPVFSIVRPTLEARKTRRKGNTMDQDTLWNECEDQDLDAHIKARVEELLADSQFLAWLDQQEAEGTCPF